MKKMTDEEFFWSRVQKTETCWLWTGSKSEHGYGVIFGRSSEKTTERASRKSYEMAYGSFDKTLHVLHKCDNPACVRPEHLFLGTQADNMHDMNAKGRYRNGKKYRGDEHPSRRHPERVPRGERHGMTSLTTDDVISIRSRRARGALLRELAAVHDASTTCISDICTRKVWRHV